MKSSGSLINEITTVSSSGFSLSLQSPFTSLNESNSSPKVCMRKYAWISAKKELQRALQPLIDQPIEFFCQCH